LNPVLAMSPGNGCRIVDARIKVRAAAASAIAIAVHNIPEGL